MRVIIAGGTGLLGSALAASLLADGHETILLARHPENASGLPAGARVERWDAHSAAGWGGLADGAAVIVNLAGESIGAGRWSTARKQRIVQSRVDAGQAIVQAVTAAKHKPQLVVQISGIGYYGVHGDEELTEESGRGSDFLAGVCKQWEAASAPVEDMGVRRVVVRTGPVLSKKGGVLQQLLLPFRFVAGGRMGSGKQWFSWIHLADQIAALRFLIDRSEAHGAFNLTAPNPVTNAELARVIGRVIRRPALLPAPAFALRLLLGEMATVVLDGQRVLPRRLQEMGFTFQFPDVQAALRDVT